MDALFYFGGALLGIELAHRHLVAAAQGGFLDEVEVLYGARKASQG